MNKIIGKIFLCLPLLFLIFFVSQNVLADQNEDRLRELNSKIQEYEQKIADLQGQQRTLSSTISYLNNKISLTTTQIAVTEQELKMLEEEIAKLSVKIEILDKSLADVSQIFGSRVEETYKRSFTNPFYFLLSASGIGDFFSQLKYLQVAQIHDRELLYQMQKSKMNYDTQKTLKEEKQTKQETLKKQLVGQQAVLAQQKSAKQELLNVTRNDEQRYQQFISEARQEIASLLASEFTGKKHVKKGEVIGLMGSTGFSTGPHLHFGVYNLSESNANNFNYYADAGDPFTYLASKSVEFEGRSCDDMPNKQSKTIGGGSLIWPMDNITITQCYGHTPYSWMYNDNFHHGIDIYSSSLSVKSVEEGEAYFYRGDSSMGNNVRVFHSDGKMTLYLHLQ